MKPVEQTILTPPLGNCFAACIASILEVPIEDVPWPRRDETKDADTWCGYMNRVNDFLEQFNVYVVDMALETQLQNEDRIPWRPRGYVILNAKSQRGDSLHSVVMKDGEVVWDPHPSRGDGIGEWVGYTAFISLNPIGGQQG